jgi:hypothetical protein
MEHCYESVRFTLGFVVTALANDCRMVWPVMPPLSASQARQRSTGRPYLLKSRAKNTEFLIHLDVNLNGAPTGDYVLAFRLHDAESDKVTRIELPVTLE